MRLSIMGFNQEKIINAKLDITDILILDYIIRANGNPSMKHIIEDEISYVWVSHKKIHEDLPILKIAEGTLKNKLYILKRDGWIQSVNKAYRSGSMTYYSVTIQCLKLLCTEDDFTGHSEVTPTGHSEVTPNSKLLDSKLNDNISKDILSADKSAKDVLDTNSHKKREKIRQLINNTTDIQKDVKEVKKKKDFWQCSMDAIDRFTDDEKLKDLLVTYVKLRKKIAKRDGDTYDMRGWNGALKTLRNLSDDVDMRCKIVQQSIDLEYRVFCPFNEKSYNRQMTEKDATAFKDGKEAKEYTDNLIKENERRGRRAVF